MNIREISKYLRKNDPALYAELKAFLNTPTPLLNKLIRNYEWMFIHNDLKTLDLSLRYHKNYLNLFLYCLDSSSELSNDFFNYFIHSLEIAYDAKTKKWDMDLITNILINKKRLYKYDLIAMYLLIAATIDRCHVFIEELEISPKIKLDINQICTLFTKIIDQKYYDKLKQIILDKRHKN